MLVNQPQPDEYQTFRSYAQRVKHISQRQTIKIPPAAVAVLSSSCSALPRLCTSYISIPRSSALLIPFNFSPSLRQLEIDLGFKPVPSGVDSALCALLKRATILCPDLTEIKLRGLASDSLNDILSAMCNIHVLSLRLGRSLLPGTLAALLTFPHLKELEVHAGHLHPNDLDDIHNSTTLPSLEKLDIRAKSSFIENLFNFIEPSTLHHLHIELDDDSMSSMSWNTIFTSIRGKTSDTLEHLSLEHHFEIPEVISSTSPDATQSPQTSSAHLVSSLDFATMDPLRNLKNLRHFSCDATLPPVIRDQDMEKLVCWWPELEHLELGSAPEHVEDGLVVAPHMTVSSLFRIAIDCPNLVKLVLPITIENIPETPTFERPLVNFLRCLTIAQLKTSTPVECAQHLRFLFPLLQELEGPCDESQVWVHTRRALKDCLVT